MAYKKYIKRGDKVFGPYYYESYRDKSGKIKKRYVGTTDPKTKKDKKINNSEIKNSGKPEKIIKKEKDYNKLKNKIFLKENKKVITVKPKGPNKKITPTKFNFNFKRLIGFTFLIIIFLMIGMFLTNNSYSERSFTSSKGPGISLGPFSKITGFVVAETNYGEDIFEEYESEKSKLLLKGPKKILSNTLSENKNKRMEFSLPDGKVRLYFDLLDYQKYVENVVSDVNDDEIILDSRELENYGNDEIDNHERNNIEDDSIVEIENNEFEIDVIKTPGSHENWENGDAEESNESEEMYKWGYNVKLKDFQFMAKIDVTSESDIQIYDDNTLKIGNSLLSFKDLIDLGYKISFEKPSLELNSKNLTMIKNISINNTNINKNITNFSLQIKPDDIINESLENITGENIIIINETNESNETNENPTISNITSDELNETNESIYDINENEIIYDNNEGEDDKYENEKGEKEIENNNIPENKETKRVKENKESKEANQDLESMSPGFVNNEPFDNENYNDSFDKNLCQDNLSQDNLGQGNFDNDSGNDIHDGSDNKSGSLITGMFGFVNMFSKSLIKSNEIEDEKYENIITVYIEKDLEGEINPDTGVEYNIGDMIYLDPTLIILITKAEHLDTNREFVSDIYDDVRTKDSVFSEVINDGEYVRVIFEQELTKINDITIYAKSVDSSDAEIVVYEKDGNEVIAEFVNVNGEDWYKVYLTGLEDGESQDVFDLRINCGELFDNGDCGVEFDYIVDPTPGAINVSDCMTLSSANTYYQLNQSIVNDTIAGDCMVITAQNITFDCDGYSITSVQNVSGVYTNQYNTTVKNCNISMGGGNSSEQSRGIELDTGSDYSNVINNTIVGHMYRGIVIYSDSTNSLVENNTIDTTAYDNTTGYGITISNNANYNILRGNSIKSSGRGIYFYYPRYVNISNNFINSSLLRGMYAYRTVGNKYENNNIYGYIDAIISMGSNDTYINNTLSSINNAGLYLSNSHNNTIINNTFLANGYPALYITGAHNNYFMNNYAKSTGDNGIQIRDDSSNNVFISDTAVGSGRGIEINAGAENNTFYYFNASSAGGPSVYFRGVNDNIFYDCKYINSVTQHPDISVNNTFVNCTFETDESVTAGSELIRKWYYRAYANDSDGNPVKNVNVKNLLYFVVNDESLIGYWKLDNDSNVGENSTHVYDWSGNGNNGTVNGNATYNSSGKIKGAYSFDGNDSNYISMGDDSDFENISEITVSYWMKSDISQWAYLVSKGWASDCWASVTFNDRMDWYVNNETGDSQSIQYSISIYDDSWHHVVNTYNGTDIVLYVDNNYKDSAPLTGRIDDCSRQLRIGSNDGTTRKPYNGSIDEVMIFNRSLTSEEISALYRTKASKFNLSTDGSGYTDRIAVIEYINNGGTREYFENYSITATKTGFSDQNHSYNISTELNIMKDNFEYQASPNYTENCIDLNQANTYYRLTDDLVQGYNQDCMVVTAQNITLDCNGHFISSIYNISGVYSDQFNTTIKNCNISMGEGDGGYGIEMGDDGENSTIVNNTLGNQYIGIYFQAENGLIENNTARVECSGCSGFIFSYADNNTIKFNNGYSSLYTGISIRGSDNIISHNNGTSVSNRGIYLCCGASESNNTLISNIGNSTSSYGVMIDGPQYNLFINNTILSYSDFGLFVRGSNNIFRNNSVSSSTSIALVIDTVDNNSFYSDHIHSKINDGGKGGLEISNSNHNEFYNVTVIANLSASTTGIFIQRSNHSLFKDCLNISGGQYDVEISSSLSSLNNTFINCSDDDSKESVNGAGNELIRKWYYRSYVNDSFGNPVKNVNVTARGETYDDITDSGLVLWMHMNNDSSVGENDSVVYDWSGNGNNGSVINAIANMNDGRVRGGYSFDGDGDYVNLTEPLSLELSDNYTITLWVYPKANNGGILKRGDNCPLCSNPGYAQYKIRYWSNGEITFSVGNGTNGIYNRLASSVGVVPLNKWTFIVCGINETDDLYCYFNGVFDQTMKKTVEPWRAKNITVIGANSLSSDNYFNGTIDEILIFNRSLSFSEILRLYQSGAGYFSSFTNSSGYIERQEIIEYKNIGGTRYYNDHTITATKSGYNDVSHQYNVSIQGGTYENNNLDDNFEFLANATLTDICMQLNQANTEYILSSDVVQDKNTDCMVVTAQNVTLDCKGYSITSEYNVSGVYSNQFNTTVKNCNISMGVGGNESAIGIELKNNADYSQAFNNTIIGDMHYGIYSSSQYSIIENNTLNNLDYIGLYFYGADYNILRNNNISHTGASGIYFSSTSNYNLIENNFLSYNTQSVSGDFSAGAIILYISDHNIVRNNLITYTQDNGGSGIYVRDNLNLSLINNTLRHLNIGTGFGGIRVRYGNQSKFINNTIINSSSRGIVLYNNYGNHLIEGNSIEQTYSYGISIVGGYNDMIINNKVNDTDIGLYISGANNTMVSDLIILDSSSDDVNLISSANITFLNVTYDMSKEIVDSGSDLTRKWYYKAYINNTKGDPVEGVDIIIYNVSDDVQDRLITNSSGNTNRTTLIEYVNIGGTRVYYNDYNITFDKNGYYFESHSLNLTKVENYINDTKMLTFFNQNIFNRSSIGYQTKKEWVNHDEDVNLTAGFFDDYLRGKIIDSVWAEIMSPDSSVENLTMSHFAEQYSDESLLLYLRMNNESEAGENSTYVHDFSGNGNNGTWYGDSSPDLDSGPTINGRIRGGFNFDGDGDYLSLGSLDSYNLNKDFTLSMWVYRNGSGDIGIIRKGASTGDSKFSQFSLSVDYSGDIDFYLGNGSTSCRTIAYANNPITLNEWHHIVITVNGSKYVTQRVNYDGFVYNDDCSSLVNTYNLNNLTYVGTTTPTSEKWNGTIDEVRVFNRTLNSSEIQELYKLGIYHKYNLTYSEQLHQGKLGDYKVRYYANYTNGEMLMYGDTNVTSNFSIQNTTISILHSSSAITTSTIPITGQIDRWNGTDKVGIMNNNFLIKLNNVTVSSDTLNHSGSSDFGSGSWDSGINVSNVVKLNLSEVSFEYNYSDDYSSATEYQSVSINYSNEGYDLSRGVLFSWNHMVGIGNVTYRFDVSTRFNNATVYAYTHSAPESAGGNTTVMYSYDNQTWVVLDSSTSAGASIGGNVDVVDREEFYIMIMSDTHEVAGFATDENPVTYFELNYTEKIYPNESSYVSESINLPDVTYTVLRWSEDLSGGSVGNGDSGDIYLQIRESDDGNTWDSWSNNYTSNLDNAIYSFSKDYIQYKAWLKTTNISETPLLTDVRILYFNASTNSTGGYDYNITIPTDSLGTLPIEVSIVNNPNTGIVGLNTSYIDIWAETNPIYWDRSNYSVSLTNYSVHVNYTRIDTGRFVNGTINISISNNSDLWSQSCQGIDRCVAAWNVFSGTGGDLSSGNYTVGINVSNESGYYINSSSLYEVWLEERNTSGVMSVFNRTLGDFSSGTNYSFLWNVSIENTGEASINDLYLWIIKPPSSDYVFVERVIGYDNCERIFPGEICNVTMNITLLGNAPTGEHQLSWRANWTNNDLSIGPTDSVFNYIAYPYMYVDIAINATISVNETNASRTIQHNQNDDGFNFKISSIGTDNAAGIDIDLENGSLPSSWVTFTPSTIAILSPAQSQDVNVNVSVPEFYHPGNYSSIINISSGNAGESLINLTVEVLTNRSWKLIPSINNTYNRSYALNTPGEVGNFTVKNIGNVNLTLSISYLPTGITDYTAFGTSLFEEDYDTGTIIANPTQVNVTIGENSTISLYQKGYDGSELVDVGIVMTVANSSTIPTSFVISDSFNIFETDPEFTNMWFMYRGENSSVAETNSNLTIKFRATDDVGLETYATVNITYGVTNVSLNASYLNIPGEYVGDVIRNYSVNFTPVANGIHNVVVEVYDQAGRSNLSDTYQFTVYGTTILTHDLNYTEINISSIDKINSYEFYVNYSVNNIGLVNSYETNLTFSKNDSYITLNPWFYDFGDIIGGENNSNVIVVNFSELTLPGQYNISSSLRWRNPNTAYSTDNDVLVVNVISNKSMDVTPAILQYTVANNGQDSKLIYINNTGNDYLQSMDVNCYTATLCPDFVISSNESGFSINPDGGIIVNYTLTGITGTYGGVYTGSLNISEDDISRIITIQATVPETYTWTASPLSVNATKGAGQSGTLGSILIENTGNMNLTFTLSSTNFSIISPENSSAIVPVLGNISIDINYSTPNEDGNYNEIISISNPSYSPTEINVSINLTSSRVNITVLYPNSSDKYVNLSYGDLIELHVNASYVDEPIINSSYWNITIGNSQCYNLSYEYLNTTNDTYYWNITGHVPNIPDGRSYNLTVMIIHDIYGDVSGYSYDTISYLDVSAPNFVVTRNNVNINQNISLSVNISDNVAIANVSVIIYYPNDTIINSSLSLSNGLYVLDNISLDQFGEYLVNYTASDSVGNINSTIDWFEVYDKYLFYQRLLDYNNQPVSDIGFEFYRPSSVFLFSNITDNDGYFSYYVNKRYYDLWLNISNHKILIENVNFTNYIEQNISFGYHLISGEDLNEIVALYKPLIGIASNSTGLENNNVSFEFNYSGQNYDNPTDLTIIKCASWNYGNRSCESSWLELSTIRDVDSRIIVGNSSGFSAYFLAESRCGNGLCESSYNEDTSSCSQDCTSGAGTTVVSGGGGGGGGGGSKGLTKADLEKIEEIVKSYQDISGVKLETASIYKEMFAGESTSVRVSLRNTLNSNTTVRLSTEGDVKDFLFYDQTYVKFALKEEKTVLIKIVLPKFVDIGNYEGDLVFSSNNKTGKIPVSIRVLAPEGKLLDVKIQPLTSTVAPGDILRLQTDLLNLGKTKRVDVQFDLQLIDIESGEVIVRNEEAFAVETTVSEVKNLTIPDYVKPGQYMVKATAYYSNIEQSMQASSIAYIRVDYHLLKRKILNIPIWMYLLFILVVIILVGLIFYYRYLESKKKRFKGVADVSKLPQVGPNSAFVGKIAETGIRTFFDMSRLKTHTLIAGSTGSGKTVAAQGIIEEALNHKKSIIVFDPTAQWTGFLRKCEDKSMIKRFRYFDMKENEVKSFDGIIKVVRDPLEYINLSEYMDRPGEITIFDVSKLTPKEIDIVVASTIEQVFRSNPEESKDLKTLLVYDEVHRLLPKFGGSGQGFVQLERGAREFRKWGIGLVLISQVLSDFIGEIKANIGTEIQMGTRYEGDLERVSMKYGDDILKSVVKEPVGTGMLVNAEYNSGKPYFVSFRPLLHSTKRLSNQELDKYEKYFNEVEDMYFQANKLKELGEDVIDLDIELKLARNKVKEGNFSMADMYLDSLRPNFEEKWKSIKRKPVHLEKKKITKELFSQGIKDAIKEREKFLKTNFDEGISIDERFFKLKKLLKEKKKNGIDISMYENEIKELMKKVDKDKKKLDKKAIRQINEEINKVEDELNNLKK